MTFEEILADCIAQLEAGATVDSCLARHPEAAQELEPLLRAVAALRSAPAPIMRQTGFVRGRTAVAEAARARQQAAAPGFEPIAAGFAPASAGSMQASARGGRTSGRLFTWPKLAGVMIAACLLLAVVAGASQAQGVLPGSPLYAVKLWGEDAQGLLMAAAGNEAAWRAQLVERRLGELQTLQAQNRPVEPALVERLLGEAESALTAATTLPEATRVPLLQGLQRDLATTGAIAGLSAPDAAALREAEDALATTLNSAAEVAVIAAVPTATPVPTVPAPTATVPPTPQPTETAPSSPVGEAVFTESPTLAAPLEATPEAPALAGATPLLTDELPPAATEAAPTTAATEAASIQEATATLMPVDEELSTPDETAVALAAPTTDAELTPGAPSVAALAAEAEVAPPATVSLTDTLPVTDTALVTETLPVTDTALVTDTAPVTVTAVPDAAAVGTRRRPHRHRDADRHSHPDGNAGRT